MNFINSQQGNTRWNMVEIMRLTKEDSTLAKIRKTLFICL